MGKSQYYWYGIARKMIECNELYKNNCSIQAILFNRAIDEALEATVKKPNGEDRLYAINEILFKKRLTYESASMTMYYSEKTIRNWITDFIKLVGKNAGF